MQIVNRAIAPLNPHDNPEQQIFVHNQIFFSFAVDQPSNFKDFCGKDQNPTFIASNQDLQGLKIL